MNVVEVFVEIDAPPDVVWEALLEFEYYPEWNPVSRTVERIAIDGTERRAGTRPSIPVGSSTGR